MQFHFIPKPVATQDWKAGFTIDRVWVREAGSSRDLSGLLDRTYQYQSARELQWHLAHRFGLAAQSLDLTSEA